MKYKDTRQLISYLKCHPATLTLDQLNHFDNLCRAQTYDLSCRINLFKNRQLRDSLFQMNIERFKPAAQLSART